MWNATDAMRYVLFGIAYALQHSKTDFTDDPNIEAEKALFHIMTTMLYTETANTVTLFLLKTFESLNANMSHSVDSQFKPFSPFWNALSSAFKTIIRFASIIPSGLKTTSVILWLREMFLYLMVKHPDSHDYVTWLNPIFSWMVGFLEQSERPNPNYVDVFVLQFVVTFCALAFYVAVNSIPSILKRLKKWITFEKRPKGVDMKDLDDWDKMKLLLNHDVVQKEFESVFKNTSIYLGQK
jgi:hypothetical protein